LDPLLDTVLSLGAKSLWVNDPISQVVISLVVTIAAALLLLVFLPLLLRLGRTSLLRYRLRRVLRDKDATLESRREAMRSAFEASPLRELWTDFLRRREGSLVSGTKDLAAFRFAELLDDRPLLPTGALGSLLTVLPGLFLALGILGTFVGLTLALQDLVPSETAVAVVRPNAEPANGPPLLPTPLVSEPASDAKPQQASRPAAQRGAEPERIASLVRSVGLALRSSLWGLIFSLLAALGGRVLVGRFDAGAEELDSLVERLYGSVSQGELATRFARFQAEGFDRLRMELATTTRELGSSLDTGLGRIETSTARAANLVSKKQRLALAQVVEEMSTSIRRGVEEHLGGLHRALELAVSHQGEVTGGLELAFKRMTQNSEAQQQVTRSLAEAAQTVLGASQSMDRSANSFEPVVERLRATGDAIESATERINQTQDLTARNVDSVRSSVEHTASTMAEQREFVEMGLTEIRGTLRHLSQTLGNELSQALRNVDDALESSVGRLRETLLESNETIDRIALPIRAAEGTTREMHAALERTRNDMVGLGEWLIQAIKPVRGTVAQLDDRSGAITRALVDFSSQLRTIDKSVEALRSSMQEEGRRFLTASSQLSARIDRTHSDFAKLGPAPPADPPAPANESTMPIAEWPLAHDAATPNTDSPPPASPGAAAPEEIAEAPAPVAKTRRRSRKYRRRSATPEPPSPPAPDSDGQAERESVFAPPKEGDTALGASLDRLSGSDVANEASSGASTAGAPAPQPHDDQSRGTSGLASLLSAPRSTAESDSDPDEDPAAGETRDHAGRKPDPVR